MPEPVELRSRNGIPKLDLAIHNQREPDGSVRYCYLLGDGAQSPTLRLSPGDLLILNLSNQLSAADAVANDTHAAHLHKAAAASPDPCRGAMTSVSTNLHFHGLTVPPLCHQDEVLRTSIQPGDPSFEYRFRIPPDELPGLYWYHPHIHGFSRAQVIGGASGALIEVAGRPDPHADQAPHRHHW